MVRFTASAMFVLTLVASATALAPPNQSSPSLLQQQQQQSRRQLFRSLCGGAGVMGVAGAVAGLPQEASATKALTGKGSVYTGDYDDPNHPGCLRQVKVVGAPIKGDGTRSPYPVVEIKGWDGPRDGSKSCEGGLRPEQRSDLWTVTGQLKTRTDAVLDFSSKGGPTNLAAQWDGSGIVFPDGNKWTKVEYGTPDRYPTDMSTLKSEY